MRWWLGLVCLVILISCGRKAPPVPPEAARPEPPSDFRIVLHPLFAELSLAVPVEDIRGQSLQKIKAFEIEKVARRPYDRGPELKKLLRISFGRSPAQTSRFYYRDRDLRPGWCYLYRVRAVKGFRSRSDWTPPRRFCWSTPPQTPENLEARRLIPHTVFLSWSPVTEDLNGFSLRAPVLYRVWRRSLAGEMVFPPLAETSFFDTSVRAGEKYCYSVEPLLSYYDTLIPGFKTPEVCVTP